MPRTHLLCEVSGQAISDNDCKTCALKRLLQPDPLTGEQRHCQYPYPYIAACCASSEGREHAGISATMIATICPRKTMWEQQKPFGVFPHSLQPSLKGTAQHAFFEQFNEEGILAEKRLVKRMRSGREAVCDITGQIDRYLPEHHRVEDYKFKSEEHSPFGIAPLNYEAQQNIYRYFLVTGCVIQETGEVIEPQEVNELVLFPSNHTDWKEVYCRIWPLDVVEWFIETMLDLLEQETPPRGFKEPETSYFCRNYCPFWEECCATGGEYRDLLVEAVEGAL